jgi:Tol biopolymer transport system component
LHPRPTLISISSAGVIRNSNSFAQAVSARGRFVAFQSYASNLVPKDTNLYPDIYLRDTCIGVSTSCVVSTTREDISSDGTQSDNSLDYQVFCSISDDGRFIAYASSATTLVSHNLEGFGNIYLRDTCIGAGEGCHPTTQLVSIGNDGSVPNAAQNNQSMSADGRYIAFASLGRILCPEIPLPREPGKISSFMILAHRR